MARVEDLTPERGTRTARLRRDVARLLDAIAWVRAIWFIAILAGCYTDQDGNTCAFPQGGADGEGCGSSGGSSGGSSSIYTHYFSPTAASLPGVVRVVMTRTQTAGKSMGNIARARIANRAHAGLFLRVHADGSASSGARGTHTLTPSLRRGWTDDVYAASHRAARLVQTELVRALGFPDRGIQERSDYTGFNWADVPVILVELGFMTNPTEDRELARPAVRERAALGLCRGTLRFFGLRPGRCGR